MEQTITTDEAQLSFLADFERLMSRPMSGDRAWLHELRRSAIGRFEQLGFPTRRHEDWKHTRLSNLTQHHFHPAHGTRLTPEESAWATPHLCEELGGSRLVFVNNQFESSLSTMRGLPPGVQVMTLVAALKTEPERVRSHLAKVADFKQNPFVALNTALMENGVAITVSRGVVVEEPIHLVYITIGTGEEPTVAHPRNLIVVGEGAEVNLLESYIGRGDGIYLSNVVDEIVAGEGSVIDHIKIQDEGPGATHISMLSVHQQRNSQFRTHSIALGSALARNDIQAVLAGEGGDTLMGGLTVVAGRQHVDHHTLIDHAQPHCHSEEHFRGILDDSATSVFSGRILVRPHAQKTDAVQSNSNLLLSGEAKAYAEPQLEIFADDVRCTHGATIGQLDAEAIFYLQSRGIDRDRARGMLTFAFANEILGRIRIEPVRKRLEQWLAGRFKDDYR